MILPTSPTKVWITRSEPGATRLAEVLTKHGHEVVVAPVLNIESIPCDPPAESVVAVVVLSEHAARCYFASGLNDRAEGASYIAVGEQTAAYLIAQGLEVHVPQRATSEGLLDMQQLSDIAPDDCVWVAAGVGGRGLLESTLGLRCRVRKLELYRRVAVIGLDACLGSVAAIVASSGAALAPISKFWQGDRNVLIITPTARVARSATALGFTNVSIADGANPAAVADRLVPPLPKQARYEARTMTDNTPDSETSKPGLEDAAIEPEDAPIEQPPQDADEFEPLQPSAPLDDDHDVFDLPTPTTKLKGRFLAACAFVFALVGLGGVGWLYYTLVYLDPLQQFMQQSATVRADNSAFREQFNRRLDELQGEAQALAQTTTANVTAIVADRERAVLKSLNEAISQAPPSAREWKLAEAEYLMRIANHRVLMEDDSAGALRLLQSADAILAELDDFALHEVRARMADEIMGLQQVRRDDLQGLYLRLEAVKSQIDELPIATPEYVERPDTASTEKTVWQMLADEFGELVRIRTVAGGEPIEPLLAPDEQRYLELNLRLSLEQAQLAALKRHQGVYEHSLSRVVEWLAAYADPADERALVVLDSLDELLQVDLSRTLPDISGSLRALSALHGNVE